MKLVEHQIADHLSIVAPPRGAWIEMLSSCETSTGAAWSPLIEGRENDVQYAHALLPSSSLKRKQKLCFCFRDEVGGETV